MWREPTGPSQKRKKPNPHTAGNGSFPAKFVLTLQDKKHKRVPVGQAVTAVPFIGVYDFPGASRPGDARERARKRKFLGDVNAVKTLASERHALFLPREGVGCGEWSHLRAKYRKRNEKSPAPVNSLHCTALLYIRAFVFEQSATGLINTRVINKGHLVSH